MTVSLTPNFESLLPHRAPMLMLSNIVSQDANSIHCRSVIQANNPLLHKEQLPGSASIELLAQASGILLRARSHDSCARPGAIVQIKAFQIDVCLVTIGATLDIHALYEAGNEEAAFFTGDVMLNTRSFFSASLMIAILAGENQ